MDITTSLLIYTLIVFPITFGAAALIFEASPGTRVRSREVAAARRITFEAALTAALADVGDERATPILADAVRHASGERPA